MRKYIPAQLFLSYIVIMHIYRDYWNLMHMGIVSLMEVNNSHLKESLYQ